MIWFSDEPVDGLVTDASAHNPKILVFKDKADAKRHADNQNITLVDEEPILQDFDLIASWLENITDEIDCKEFLNCWNMFTDVATTLKVEFKGDKKGKARNRIYDKLFFGNNIPAITPEGEKYLPKWTIEEVGLIAEIMKQGLMMFRNSLKEV